MWLNHTYIGVDINSVSFGLLYKRCTWQLSHCHTQIIKSFFRPIVLYEVYEIFIIFGFWWKRTHYGMPFQWFAQFHCCAPLLYSVEFTMATNHSLDTSAWPLSTDVDTICVIYLMHIVIGPPSHQWMWVRADLTSCFGPCWMPPGGWAEQPSHTGHCIVCRGDWWEWPRWRYRCTG